MSALRGVRVLLVDDDEGVREAVKDYLVDCGADVAAVSSAAAAMQAMAETMPDVVVSDVSMPGRDGFWLIRTIRALAAPRNTVPAIAITGRLDITTALLAAGFTEVRSKPLDMPEMVALLLRLATPR